jgi:ankyrin repeat protein
MVQLLLDAKVFVTACDGYGCTALHHAIRENHFEIAELLLRSGADPHATNLKGKSPLDLAPESQRAKYELLRR